MKKSIVCFLLAVLMILPVFTACGGKYVETETEAQIYTLYTICDESTTPEAIREVELALNRILYFRENVIVDLRMVSESEYDEFLATELAKVEEYLAENEPSTNDEAVEDEAVSDQPSTEESSAVSDEAVSDESVDNSSVSEEVGISGPADKIISGDDILKMLEDGKDIESIETLRPRVDIFLVRGYDNYYKLATEGKLYQLDSELNVDNIELKSCINTTMFEAAKVDGWTYGVPVNTAIGESTYFVFDKQILDDIGLNTSTIKSVDDLQNYLSAVQQKYPDVVPLNNITDYSTDNRQFLLNNGFPAIVSNKTLYSAYEDTDVLSYFSTVATYNALGYFDNANKNADENTRFAVGIEIGTADDINNRLGNVNNDKYELVRFGSPIATNETAINNLFCVSSTVDSTEIKNVMKILEEINTDPQLLNIMTYGVEGIHYTFDDYGQVVRTEVTKGNDKVPYLVDPNHIGNCFLAYTLEGENPDKWKEMIEQNKSTIASLSLGFTYSPSKFDIPITITKINEETEAEVSETINIQIEEPDYISIFNEISGKYYGNLMSGAAIEINYDELVNTAIEEIRSDRLSKLDAEFGEDEAAKQEFIEYLENYIIPDNLPGKVNELISAKIKEYTDNIVAELNATIEAEINSRIVAALEENGIEDTEDVRNAILAAIGYKEVVIVEGGNATEEGGETSNETSGEASDETSNEVSNETSVETSNEASDETSNESSDETSDETSGETDGETDTESSTTYKDKYESWLSYVLTERLQAAYRAILGEPIV